MKYLLLVFLFGCQNYPGMPCRIYESGVSASGANWRVITRDFEFYYDSNEEANARCEKYLSEHKNDKAKP